MTKKTKKLDREINFCEKLAENNYNPVAHVLSASVGSLLICQPDKFGCVFHEDKK